MKKFFLTLALPLSSFCLAEEPIVIWEHNSVKPAHIASFAILLGAQHRVYVRALIHTAETIILESESPNSGSDEKLEILKAQTASSLVMARNPDKTEENQFVDQWAAKAFEHISEDIMAQKPLDPALIAEAAATVDALSKGFARDFDAWKQLGGKKIGRIAWNGIQKAAREANKRD